MKLWTAILIFFVADLLFSAAMCILLKRRIECGVYGVFSQTVSYDIVDIVKMDKDEIERMRDETLSPKEWELASENYKKLVGMHHQKINKTNQTEKL